MEQLAGGKILYTIDPPRANIAINRPEKRNAMTYDMWRALVDAYRRACRDERVRIVIVRGEGGSFSAGDDIREMYNLGDIADAKRFFAVLEEAFQSVIECPKITLAVVEGPAVGGGGELLLAMDYVIATPNAYTGFPEIRIGLIPPVLTTLGPYFLGVKMAKKLALSGRFITAEEARRMGIFDEIVEEDKVEEAINSIVDELLKHPHEAIKSIKRVINASIAPAYMLGMSELIQLVLSDEAKTRMKLFLEKRLTKPS